MDTALLHYTQAASVGNAIGYTKLGNYAGKEQDYAGALYWHKLGDAAGSHVSSTELAVLILCDYVTGQDQEARAMAWRCLDSACKTRDGHALYIRGYLLVDLGKLCEGVRSLKLAVLSDDEPARKYLSKLAENRWWSEYLHAYYSQSTKMSVWATLLSAERFRVGLPNDLWVRHILPCLLNEDFQWINIE